ncbi:MAG TPA: alpha/beta hydrolase [Bacillales bacterium]|nr:alpha/beta hydrolase [Bacillales bacterium]
MANNQNIPFLFIHGAGGSSTKWRNVPPFLNEDSATFLDLPGHGQNRSICASTIEEFASVLSKDIQDDVIVVGHSMGGLIGLELAAINENVKGLILVCSHYEMPVHPSLLEKLSEGIFPLNFFHASYAKNVDEELLREEMEELELLSLRTAYSDFECCNKYKNGKEVLNQLNIPILAIYGSEDRLISKDAREKLLHEKHNAYTTTIEGSGHYAALEKAQLFTQQIVNFREKLQYNYQNTK